VPTLFSNTAATPLVKKITDSVKVLFDNQGGDMPMLNYVKGSDGQWRIMTYQLYVSGQNSDLMVDASPVLSQDPDGGSVSQQEKDRIIRYKKALKDLDDALGVIDKENKEMTYIIRLQYPPTIFTPGSDGAGYLAHAMLLDSAWLSTSSGGKLVNAGTLCAFENGYYVP
jgi:hypothetical protein